MTPYYDDGRVTIYHGDVREILPDVVADVLVTDPPFNVAKDYGTSQDNLPLDEYGALMRAVAETGPETQAWVTPSNRLSLYASALPTAVPVVVRRGAQGPKRWGWYDQFDMILVRGKPLRWTSNLWDDIRLKGEGYFFREDTHGHPGYTPYAIVARLVSLLAEPGQVVVDCFAGTGGTLVAAKAAGCRGIGVELDEAWCEVAAHRCAQDVLDYGAAA